MAAAGVIQNGGVLPHLHHQRRGVHPGAVRGCCHPLRLRRGEPVAVLLHQREDAHRRVIVKDQRALGGHLLHLHKDPVGAVPHVLDLVPLRRIRDRHPEHRLVRLYAIARQAQVIAAHHQHGPRPGAVFLGPYAHRQPRRKNLATGRAPHLFECVTYGAQ